MRGRAWIVAAAVALLVGLPAEGEAQRRGRSGGGGADGRGSPSVSLEVGAGIPAFVGLWARLGDRASLGLEAELAWAREKVDEEDGPERTFTSSRLGVGPSLKLYLDDGAVAPFLYGHLGLSHLETESEGTSLSETSASQLTARAAAGLEWFASSRFSVGGNLGLSWRSWEEESESITGEEREVERSSLRLFTSGVSVTFHF